MKYRLIACLLIFALPVFAQDIVVFSTLITKQVPGVGATEILSFPNADVKGNVICYAYVESELGVRSIVSNMKFITTDISGGLTFTLTWPTTYTDNSPILPGEVRTGLLECVANNIPPPPGPPNDTPNSFIIDVTSP